MTTQFFSPAGDGVGGEGAGGGGVGGDGVGGVGGVGGGVGGVGGDGVGGNTWRCMLDKVVLSAHRTQGMSPVASRGYWVTGTYANV